MHMLVIKIKESAGEIGAEREADHGVPRISGPRRAHPRQERSCSVATARRPGRGDHVGERVCQVKSGETVGGEQKATIGRAGRREHVENAGRRIARRNRSER